MHGFAQFIRHGPASGPVFNRIIVPIMSVNVQPLPAFWMPVHASIKVTFQALHEAGVDWLKPPTRSPATDPWQALRDAHARAPDHDVLLLRGDLSLPTGFWPRMAGAWQASPAVDVLSCLDSALLPVPEGVVAADADATCWQHGEHALLDSAHAAMHGSLWRASALARLFAEPGHDAVLGLLHKALLPCVWIGGDGEAVNAVPENWLLPLANQLQSAGPVANNLTRLDHSGDGRPVLLHVLHAWGGGIECFARDLQVGDDQRHHLFLLSQHDHYLPPFGRRMSLFADLDAPALRTWELANPIEDTAMHSREMQRLLESIVAEWGIGAVLVSSLIGHSLDVLRTGLPTAVCVHDVYPLWPLLHDSRDPRESAFDAATLRQKIADSTEPLLFRQRDAGHWQRLRQAYVDTLVENRIAMVTPSEFSRARICAIEPALAALDWQEIAHGAPVMPRLAKADSSSNDSPDTARPLRVLVPGHIPGGKGERLLRELLPRLSEGFEIFLLGAGPTGLPFKILPGVRFQEHYRREDLADAVASFRPDLALLPSTVPETWGYVLTEMLQLGIPVLAGRMGAYAERLRDGEGGWLVEPTADAMIEALLSLRDRRERLTDLPRVPPTGFCKPQDMAAAWRNALPARPFAPSIAAADCGRVQALLNQSRWRQQLRQLSQDGERLHEQCRVLDAIVNDEREQRHLLECDLAIKVAKLDLADLECESLQADKDDLQQESVAHLQALALAEDDLGRTRRELAKTQLNAKVAGLQLLSLQSRLDGEHEKYQQLRHELHQRTQQVQAAEHELATNAETLALLQQQLAKAEHDIGDRDTAMAARNSELETSDARLHAAQSAFETAAGELNIARTQAVTLQAQATQAIVQMAHLERTTGRLRDALDATQTELDEVYQSRSWRITAGMRSLKLSLLASGASLQYRIDRLDQWLRRASASLRNRGLRASWRRFRQQPSASTVPPLILSLAAGSEGASEPAFTPVVGPKASIIIPVYNQIPITLDCLAAITERGAACSFEVIVVDDASGDAAAAELAGIPGLQLHRNAQNLGFIGACNAGAALAKGEFLVFLNNDTLVQPDWLDALLDTFETHPDTGLAGSKLVYPDGRLQEAGGIVFSDGSGWNYGRFADPSHPAFNFVREVDYCSGAAIAIRRELFNALGGFDSHYAPAYYEDTDLAMRAREHGLKVRYQPASVVVHLEGATSGTDLQKGAKAYQRVNHKKFFARWQSVLEREHPAPGSDIAIASSHRCQKRILVIDACTPMPDRDSGSVRMFELLRLMIDEGHAVSFFADNHMHDGHYTQALQQLGVQVWWHPWLSDVPSWLKEHGSRFDAVVVSRHYILTPLLPLLRQHAAQARIVFDTVDLHFLREQREAEQRGDNAARKAAQHTRAAELSLIRSAHETWVVSPVEQQLLAELEPGARVAVLSNIHRPRGLGPGYGERRDLMFVGGYRHTPNVDAVLWLANEIFPLVRRQHPDIRLHLVGSDTPDCVHELAAIPGIIVHGHVPDLMPMLDSVRINLAPLRYGAGVKGKINLSLAHGLPVVATSCAAEGMQLVDRVDAMVADSAEGFAQSVLDLYDDADLWRSLAEAGLENTRRHFSPERARPVLRCLFGDPEPLVSGLGGVS